jgi:hypothetical protein
MRRHLGCDCLAVQLTRCGTSLNSTAQSAQKRKLVLLNRALPSGR